MPTCVFLLVEKLDMFQLEETILAELSQAVWHTVANPPVMAQSYTLWFHHIHMTDLHTSCSFQLVACRLVVLENHEMASFQRGVRGLPYGTNHFGYRKLVANG